MKLNLGCGNKKMEGYINCDISKQVNPDKVLDIREELPFSDNCVDEIIVEHILEHINDLESVLKEFHRVCRNGARIYIATPYFSHESAYSNYQHKRFFTWTTFDLFEKNHSQHFHTTLNFKIRNKRLFGRFSKKYHLANLFPRIYQEYLCWIFPVKEIKYELEVIK